MRNIIFIFIFIILLLHIYKCSNNYSGKKQPIAKNGVIDLSDWDFEKDGSVKLIGEWEFYWKQLLEPEVFQGENQPVKTGSFSMPDLWNGYQIDGKKLPGKGYATFTLKVPICISNVTLSMKIPRIGTAMKLWVNNQLQATTGKVGKSKVEMTPQWVPRTTSFFVKNHEIYIVLQISNFYHQKGGVWGSLELGNQHQIREKNQQLLAFDLFLLGSLVIMAIYHFGLYWLRRKDPSVLYFGGLCLIIAIRLLVTGECFLISIFPDLPYAISYRIRLIYYLAVPLFLMFIGHIYPIRYSSKLIRVFQSLGIIFYIGVLIVPTEISSYTLPYETIVIIAGLYIIAILIIAAVKKKEGALIVIAGFFILFLTVINDILYSNQLINTGYITPFGLFIFVFSQAFLLSKRFSRSFSMAETLSLELEDKVTERTRELEASRDEIQKLNEFSKIINETMNLDEILNKIFAYIDSEYDIDSVIVMLVDKEKNELFSYSTTSPEIIPLEMIEFGRNLRIPLDNDSGMLYKTYLRKRPFYLSKIDKGIYLSGSKRMQNIIKSLELNSFLMVPLVIQEEVIALTLFTSKSKHFKLSKKDINSISSFCEQIAGAIYSSSLLKQVQEEREKSDTLLDAIMKDLDKARNIQQSLLPKEMPERNDLKLGARYIPMEQVGGDLYDFIEFPNGRLGIFIADVSGHGIPAAMISSMAKLVLAIFGMSISSPSEYLTYLNKFIEGKIAGNFLTCFYCIIDPVEKKMYYANAGHPPFLHIRDGKINQLRSKGRLVGVFDELNIEEKQLQLKKNDRFLFYTDGITEVFNSEGEEFGEERLAEVTLKKRNLSLEEHLNEIIFIATEFGGAQEMQDDATLVGLEIL
jgi:serine phosphatase RsbU (regulator of sigma subunit)